MNRLLLTPLFALALVAAACGSDGTSDVTTVPPGNSSTSTTTTVPPTTEVPIGNEDGVLVQISYEGGFVPMEFIVNRVPSLTLFTDGTVITEGVVPAIFPGPAMPVMQQTSLDDSVVAEVLELIEIVGLPDITELRNREAANFVADASETVVRYFDANGEHLFGVYALGIGGPPGDNGTSVPDEVLTLGLLVDRLNTADSTGPSEPYEPVALQLALLDPEQSFVDPQFANTLPWPFGSLTIDDFAGNDFVGCATLDGADATAAVAALVEANSVTTYELDGEEHRIMVRPLLPGERPCSMLDA